jgi:DDE family transposase
VDEEVLDRVRGYHAIEAYKKAYRKRAVWVEPLFAEGKDWHGLRRFRLRLLWRVNCEALRIAVGQNLKRLLKKRGWGRRPFPVEALCAFFFVLCWWFTCPSVVAVPFSLWIGSTSRMNKSKHILSY